MSEKLYERLMAVYGTKEAAREIVDLYAEESLSEEMTLKLQEQAMEDPELQVEMASLKDTVDALHREPKPPFSEETSQRILTKLLNRGVQTPLPEIPAAFWQYHLPIQG